MDAVAMRALAVLAGLASSAAADSWTSTDAPVPIADHAVVTLPVEVDAAFVVTDVNAIVTLEHGNAAQLRVRLQHPDGTTVLLFAGLPGTAVVHLCADDEAGAAPASGRAPYTGSWLPAQSLAAFDGKPAAGTWKLLLEDTVTGLAGSAQSVTLAFNGRTYVSSDTPQPILDGQLVEAFAQVHAIDVQDVDFTAWLEHTCPSDLTVSLEGTAGPGSTIATHTAECAQPGGFHGTTWDGESPYLLFAAPNPHRGRFSVGLFDPLALLDGPQPAGAWRLAILDFEPADIGLLRAWSIHVTGPDLCPAAAALVPYGRALPGTLTPPTIQVTLPQLASPLHVTVSTWSAQQAEAVLLAGLQPAALPLKGGTLLVDPLVVVPFHIPPLPAWLTHFQGALPGDTVLCGTSLYLQVLHEDAGAPQGVVLSEGLELVLGG